MAIPTNYTRTTFADYLKNEVLFEGANHLMWLDIQEATSVHAGRAVVLSGSTSNDWLDVEPLTEVIPASTTLTMTLTGHTFVTKAVVHNPGDTRIEVTTNLANNYTNPAYRTITYPGVPALPRILNPIYDAIIDETLLRAGLGTTIESITGTDSLKKLRMFGRREVWRMAMQNMVTEYDYASVAGVTNRSDAKIAVTTLFAIEDQRVRNTFTEYQEQIPSAQTEITSRRVSIKPRW